MTTAANQAAHAEKVQLVEAFRTACREWNNADPATDTVQTLVAEGNALYLSARALVEHLERNESHQPPHCYSDCMAAMHSVQHTPTPNLEGLRDRLFDEPLPARHSDGHCYHPALPDTDEDVNIVMLLAAFGVACKLVSMESDSPILHETLLEAGDPDFSAWTPTPPAGDGWKLLALYDTEDGPHALFGRKDHNAAFPKRAAPSMKPSAAAACEVLIAHAEGRIRHRLRGLCPDSIEGAETRDPDCPVCQALSAASPAVAPTDLWPLPAEIQARTAQLPAAKAQEGSAA